MARTVFPDLIFIARYHKDHSNVFIGKFPCNIGKSHIYVVLAECPLYTARLRLEKLDSETHENILHDGAVFCIYAAKRDDTKDGEGKVLFYEEDTQIAGSEEFLTAMGALDIRPVDLLFGTC